MARPEQLADKVRAAVKAELAAQADAPRLKAEQERLAEEEKLRKLEEMRTKLKEDFQRLETRRLLEGVQLVWQGGEIDPEPTIGETGPEAGMISQSLTYEYDDIHYKQVTRELNRWREYRRQEEDITRTNYVDGTKKSLTISLSSNQYIIIRSRRHEGVEGDDGFFHDRDITAELPWLRLNELDDPPSKIETVLVDFLKGRIIAGDPPIPTLAEQAKARVEKFAGKTLRRKEWVYHPLEPEGHLGK